LFKGGLPTALGESSRMRREPECLANTLKINIGKIEILL